MSEWHYFPMWEARGACAKTYTESERQLLELSVATQITSLLMHYGKEECVGIDNCENGVGIADDITLIAPVLEPVRLQDDSVFTVGLFPYMFGRIRTDLHGAYALEHNDDEGRPLRLLTVWDPSVHKQPRVHTDTFAQLQIDELQELHEALEVVEVQFATHSTPKGCTLPLLEYPLPVHEPEFLAVIEGF